MLFRKPVAVSFFSSLVAAAALYPAAVPGADPRTSPPDAAAAARGRENMLHKAYLPPDFSQAALDALWMTWDGKDGEDAKAATTEERRKIMARRYGFLPAPFENQGAPVTFTAGEKGWSFSCLACHAGNLRGETVLGLGNNRMDFQTWIEDFEVLKQIMAGQPPTRPVQLAVQQGSAVGTNNGAGVGAFFLSFRNPDLSVRNIPAEAPVNIGDMKAPPMDTPPWWNVKHKRKALYVDGIVPASARASMQALMDPRNSGEWIQAQLGDFEDIRQWIHTLEAPKYPGELARPEVIEKGRSTFLQACASCHGTYGPGGRYPERLVAIDDVGTDRLRLDGFTKEYRAYYDASWFGDFGKDPGLKPKGYVAPPLDGIWATAPYLHNGSVPTLEGILTASKRPAVWKAKRGTDGPEAYDLVKVGLALEEGVDSVPAGLTAAEQRRYYDTLTVPGQSNAGHTYPDELVEEKDKPALLEYLKTL